MNKPIVKVLDLGEKDYKETWDLQTDIHEGLKKAKREENHLGYENTLILVEHPPVYTLGKSGQESHVIWNEAERKKEGVSYYKINRGGDITYHGPGQLVAYPIFDLDQFKRDVHWYVRSLEEVVIDTLSEFGIESKRLEGYTGVWIEDEKGQRKVCAIGVHLSRWVSMHGLALNVDPRLRHFKGIVPCGIDEEGKSVTSMSQELRKPIEVKVVKEVMIKNFQRIYNFEIKANEL
jgi:lipoyl(octanoyl) transferase